MAPKKSRTRKLLIATGVALGVVLLVIAALPLWFPWLCRPVLKNFGVRYESYERIGYSRFALHNVNYEKQSVSFKAGRAEAFLPLHWFWLADREDAESAFLRVGDWRFEIGADTEKETTRDKSARPDSLVAALEKFETTLASLRRWLPVAHLTNGAIEIISQEIDVPVVGWQQGKLTASIRSPQLEESAVLNADLSRSMPHSLSVRSEPTGVALDAQLDRGPKQWSFMGDLAWQRNHLTFTNRIGRTGWWPEYTILSATNLQLRAETLMLEGYEDVRGDLFVEGKGGEFQVRLEASAQPLAEREPSRPPVDLVLRARANPKGALLEEVRINSPWLQAELSENVGVQWTRPWLTNSVRLEFASTLDELPVKDAGGQVRGSAVLKPTPDRWLAGEFNLSGTNVVYRDFATERLSVRGEIDGPALRVDSATIEFPEKSSLTLSGNYRLDARKISGTKLRFSGDWVRRFLPENLEFANVELAAEAEGSIADLTHSGKITVEEFSAPPLAPLQLTADWKGQQFKLDDVQVQATAENAAIQLAGALSAAFTNDQQRFDLSLREFTLRTNDQTLYALSEPAQIVVESTPPQREQTNRVWRVTVDSLNWTGEQRHLTLAGDVTWPRSGQLNLGVRGLSLDWFRHLLTTPNMDARIDELSADATWNNGPAQWNLSFAVGLIAPDSKPFEFAATLAGDKEMLDVRSLTVSGQTGRVVTAKGTLPLILQPPQWPEVISFRTDAPIDLHASLEPNPVFWERAGKLTGVHLVDPEIELNARGTPGTPQGQIHLTAALVRVELTQTNRTLPRMEDLRVVVSLNRQTLEVDTFVVEVEGQPVNVEGSVPLGTEAWRRLILEGELPDWQQARARLQIDDAELAPFTRYLPTVFSPQGKLNTDLRIEPGGEVRGELKLADAATRPLMPMGPIREISANVQFSGRAAEIKSFSGVLGGQPVKITGEIRLPELQSPQYDLKLRGANVPLAREPGLVLRSDLDARLEKTGKDPARLTGAITLRDSVFLQDLKALVRPGPARPTVRPPYFSIEEEPFADWRLDLKILGDRFLRARAPLFRGEVSARFQLRGTMREPILLGEARVNSGVVQFPFANLSVDQGLVTLASDNPYQPELFITASSRAYGYNVRMEVTGPAEEPVVLFTSTPPLNSEEIILMLTAGELPRREYTFSQEQRAGRLAMFLGRDLLRKLGLEDDAADRLTIRSGESIAEEGGLTYYIEYRLTDRWSAVGEYDRFNELNAGLKWKIYSK